MAQFDRHHGGIADAGRNGFAPAGLRARDARAYRAGEDGRFTVPTGRARDLGHPDAGCMSQHPNDPGARLPP